MSVATTAKKSVKSVICLPAGVLSQSMKDKHGNRVGVFYATFDASAPMSFKTGWSKRNTKVVKKIKEIRIPANKISTENITADMVFVESKTGGHYIKKIEIHAPIDEYDAKMALSVAKRRMSGDITKTEKEIRSTIANPKIYLNQYRYFLNRCLSYFKP